MEEQSRRRGRKDGTRHRERAGLRLEQGQLLHCNLREGRTRAQRTRKVCSATATRGFKLPRKGCGWLGKTQLSVVAVNLFASFVATGAAV